jgi:UDP-N-acetyl-D-glucosamine dehydrogenase
MIDLMVDLKNRTLAIIGQGYVGLPLAMAAVEAGWTVVGVDIIEEKVTAINSGLSPIEDVSNKQLQDAIANGSYSATTDFAQVARASVIALCVPTPLNAKREPDVSMLLSAAKQLAPYIANETLIASESTSFPGTLRKLLIPEIESLKPADAKILYYASAPERVNPGDLIWNQRNTPRLVGGIDQNSRTRAVSFYASICEEVVPVNSPEIAEAAKLLENTFRLVNIALINQVTQLCAADSININEVIDAAATKPYGYMPFRPGVGVGGHCIPVDPLYLTWWGRENGVVADLINSADAINADMPRYVAQRALNLIDNSIKNPRVLILGVAYKPGVGDVRETPMKELRNTLTNFGAEVAWHDPLVSTWEGTSQVGIDWDCDLAIFANIQPGMDIKRILTKGIPILDCVNSQFKSPNLNLL